LSVTSPQLAKKFARGGLCPRGAKTETSSWVRQQGFTVQSVPAPRTGFHGMACPCSLSIKGIRSPGAVAERYERISLQLLGRDPPGNQGAVGLRPFGRLRNWRFEYPHCQIERHRGCGAFAPFPGVDPGRVSQRTHRLGGRGRRFPDPLRSPRPEPGHPFSSEIVAEGPGETEKSG